MESAVARRDAALPAEETRLDRFLKLVSTLLIGFVASHLIVQLASIPEYYRRVTTGSVPALVIANEVQISNALIAQYAAERGMTLPAYALYSIALNVVVTLGCVVVAVLILWKARREWFHRFTAMILLFIPSGGLWVLTMVTRIAYHYVALGSLLWPAFLVFLYLFPNGRAVPRWVRLPVGFIVVLHLIIMTVYLAASFSLASTPLFELAYGFISVVFLAFPLILFSQIYRYVRVSTEIERAQIKWFVVGLAAWLLIDYLLVYLSTGSITALEVEGGLGRDLDDLIILIIPLTIGIGILRYRLYDIDLIIRRTLVYGLLTAALALLYFGSVLVFQSVFRALTGASGQSSLVIVISTLAIAALFNPLRRAIQQFIDRRFFRRRYNAEETLQAFAGTLRDEVNVDQLSTSLLGVVQDTLQPAGVSLWLRRPEGQPSTQQPNRQ